MNELSTRSSNGFPSAQKTPTAMMISRQAQEVQAAMVVAKQFPRDQQQSYNNIMTACQRVSLAENAIYEYPKGGTSVTGPSIRLAEAIAQTWGNIDFGFMELDQKDGASSVMAYCWDLETNTRRSVIFEVPHIRYTKKGSYALTDPREIYELIANQAARRVRACILSVIPGDVVEAAVNECQRTTERAMGKLADRVEKMVQVFQEEFGVPVEALEAYLGCNKSAFSKQGVLQLSRVYTSLKEGRASVESFFPNLPAAKPAQLPEAQQEKTRGKQKQPEEIYVDTATGEVIAKGMSLDDL